MSTIRTLITAVAILAPPLAGLAFAQVPAQPPKPLPKSCVVKFVGDKEVGLKPELTSSDGCTWRFIHKDDQPRKQGQAWPLFGIKVDAVTVDEKVGAAGPRRTPSTSLQFESASQGWPEDIVQGPASGIKSLTTAFSQRPALFVWSDLNGTLAIDYDDPSGPVAVTVKIERFEDVRSSDAGKSPNEWTPVEWQDLLRRGYSVTMSITPRTYQTLVDFARCVQVGPDESTCLAGLRKTWSQGTQPGPAAWQTVSKNGSTTSLKYSSDKDAVTAGIYYMISRWLARDPAYDFTTSEGGKRERASKSEPIVLFAGVAGLNRIAILDCQHPAEQAMPGGGKYYRCSDFAKPSAQTLERAKYFWAIYVEDADVPFDTSIEVEFGATARDPDYEEFDPRVVPVASHAQELPRRVRIGFRRFRIREAPSVAQVAFTRQGPGYGVRQWVRVYRQRSQWWAVPAGTLVAPAVWVTQRRVVVANTPPAGNGPAVLTIEEQPTNRLLFAAASVQWPQLRAKADDSGAWQRLWYNSVPDVTLGLADTNVFFVGGSWPIPLWRDRTYLTLGMTAIGNDVLKDGYTIGQQLPPSTTRDDVIVNHYKDWQFGFRIAISVELFKARR